MPSWSIHTAHVERLLAEESPSALGIRDVNAFLFGNLVPDVFVGWMVPNASRKIDYCASHFATLGSVPEPRYDLFWERYAQPSADAEGHVSDVVLGAWTHLLADHVYNARFNRVLTLLGMRAGPVVRKRKQSDFNIFGRTLHIHLIPRVTSELLAQCAAFPQYALEEADVTAACAVMEGIVRENAERHVSNPIYDLLDPSYFQEVPDEVDALMREALHAYAAGDATWGRLR